MAGYLFGLDSEDSLNEVIRLGIYSTRLSLPTRDTWLLHHEGTFADYSSMKAGDNVYFFIDRKIYGIGELVGLEDDCKSLNFPFANSPEIFPNVANNRFIYLYPRGTFDSLTVRERNGLTYNQYKQQYRFVCYFSPAPSFFVEGVDMDIHQSGGKVFVGIQAVN